MLSGEAGEMAHHEVIVLFDVVTSSVDPDDCLSEALQHSQLSVKRDAELQSEASTQVELSESAGFVQGLREMAEGVDPQEVRQDVVEASREDLRKGLLGSEQDYEQTINALLTESNDFED